MLSREELLIVWLCSLLGPIRFQRMEVDLASSLGE